MGLPPTEKQLKYLVHLEGEETAPPTTKSEAQYRITKHTNEIKRLRRVKMAQEPPSEKQLNALKKFGVEEVPATKLAASDLLDPKFAEMKRNRRTTKRQKQAIAQCEITFVDPSTLKEQA
jgi:hypothetical protein